MYAVINYTINERDCDEKYKYTMGEGQYFLYEDITESLLQMHCRSNCRIQWPRKLWRPCVSIGALQIRCQWIFFIKTSL